MGVQFEKIGGLLLIAAVVAMLARRLSLPYTVGLVLAGIALKLSPINLDIQLTKQLVFTTLLPPLIFEAALYLPWKQLRRDLPVSLVLATLGVALSAGLTALGMHFIASWSWMASLLFGVLIAATDPVSVIATFKESGVRGRLRLLVEAESLFNDGTAVVLLGVVLTLAAGGTFGAAGVLQQFMVSVFGGILCGAAIAGALLLMAGRSEDHLVELTFTTIAAYGSFLLAEHFHLSGVLATLTTGVMIGNTGSLGAITDRGREAVELFWEYAAFLANSLIFLLIGMHEARQNFLGAAGAAATAILLVLLGRAAAVYPCCALFARSVWRVEFRHQHVLFWGGLRGALALALALGLPSSFPERENILTAAFAVVAFSVFVQGLTMPFLLRKTGVLPSPGESSDSGTLAGD